MKAIFAALLFVAASAAPSRADGCASRTRAELLEQVAKERTAHLRHDVDLLLSIIAVDFVSVDNGAITRPSRSEFRKRFENYFNAVEFRAWHDLEPPAVSISDDCTLATVLVHKLVRTVERSRANDPSAKVSETRFAWVELWRRRAGRWENAMIVSTRSDVR